MDTKYANLELIIIDNNSETKPKSVSIQNSTNIGLPRAWNQGLDQASGDYILILNPDTRLPRNFLLKRFRILSSIPASASSVPNFSTPTELLKVRFSQSRRSSSQPAKLVRPKRIILKGVSRGGQARRRKLHIRCLHVFSQNHDGKNWPVHGKSVYVLRRPGLLSPPQASGSKNSFSPRDNYHS